MNEQDVGQIVVGTIESSGITKPFHETVVASISGANPGQMSMLADLLLETDIPGNHKAIMSAWRQRCTALSITDRRLLSAADGLLERHRTHLHRQAQGWSMNDISEQVSLFQGLITDSGLEDSERTIEMKVCLAQLKVAIDKVLAAFSSP
ncbi:hypothetical protein A2480_02100 [Candidatus Uhrbacteria bacterium RIFOXYC2_FULL_47_19]|uniref:Uncharacterized protein n=1 Tax=Candidatus Uhrbacteria bacterium RIFOXYC2_FULL_47_19 TaxID=1802424 RepID=A0A1F7WET4_9BACT|nr:MAG: hypothetical protein A2480_02100 [Candidatus Uhrbacteria bacterium RIFOXYC2_FULL_47_19]HCC22461.1 hypothetical protein [Candidatus Uhrbacteria bacterium]